MFTCNYCKRSEPEVKHTSHGLCRGCGRMVKYKINNKKDNWEELQRLLEFKQARPKPTEKRLSIEDQEYIERIKKLYLEEGRSLNDVAEILKVSYGFLYRLTTEHSIRRRSRKEASYAKNNLNCIQTYFTEEEKQIVFGTVLGDGFITRNDTCESQLSIEHSIKQYDYLIWKADKLKEFRTSVKPSSKDCFKFTTSHLPLFTEIRKLFYPNDIKIVTHSILEQLQPLALAVWYMDDGWLSLNNNGIGLCHLATHCFSLLEQELIKSYFLNKWELESRIANDKKDDKLFYHIQFTAESSRKFIEIIRSYIHPTLLYKINENRKEYKESKTITKQELLEKVNEKYSIYKNNEFLKKFLIDDVTDEDLKLIETVRERGFPYTVDNIRNLEKRFNNLKKLNYEIEEGIPFSLKGQEVGNYFCKAKVKATRKDKISLFDAFYDDVQLLKAFKYIKEKGLNINSVAHLRNSLHMIPGVSLPSNFRASAAKWIYDKFNCKGKIVLDPCAGFGQRMTGAAAAGVSKYICYDVNSELTEELKEEAKFLGTVSNTKFSIILEDYTQSKLKEQIDFIFTSPPYFDREIYSKDEKQSLNIGSYEEWIEKFLKVLLQKSFSYLKNDGICCINIGNVGTKNTTNETIKLATQIGFEYIKMFKYLLHKHRLYDHSKGYEPIFVFKKS